MQSTYAAPSAWPGPLAMALVLVGLLAMPAPAHAARSQARPTGAPADAGWHGRAIRNPLPRPRLARVDWPKGWSAGPVKFGTGYVRPGGSDRVREVQRRLIQLGYRPGPVDGLFGPRTRAATRWFQYKHGLRPSGRVNRSTLAVLQARSDHKPLPRRSRTESEAPAPTGTSAAPQNATAAPDGVPVQDDGAAITWLLAGLLIMLALALGTVVGLLTPGLRRRRAPAESPAPRELRPPPPVAPRPRQLPASAPPVLGYFTVDREADGVAAATAAIALRCVHRGWSLVEVVRDRCEAGSALSERPGLTYALHAIRHGRAHGLVVARLSDLTHRVDDLATLLTWLEAADAFLGAADHELDTSTRAGRATAGAVIEIARWERARLRVGADRTPARFSPARAEITDQIAVMHERGLSFRAIADALNLVGVAGPAGHTAWRVTDVKAATEESRTS